MIYKADGTDINRFLSLPESGMGYQLIEARPFGETYKKQYVVYNCELIVDNGPTLTENQHEIKSRGFSVVFSNARYWFCDTDSISLLPRANSRVMNFSYVAENVKSNASKGAVDNPKEFAKKDDVFVRISAYKNDMRIDFQKKRLINGSFATTFLDYYQSFLKKSDPIDRYALPNDEMIEWAFYVHPSTSDQLQKGVVQPANGHNGGGIEAYFEYGTSTDTVRDPVNYGR
jgi:hypothetical protein